MNVTTKMNKRQAQFVVQMLRSSEDLSSAYEFIYIQNKKDIYRNSYLVIAEYRSLTLKEGYIKMLKSSDVMAFITSELPKIRMENALQ